MKNFILACLGVSLVLLSMAGSYYLVIYIPKQQSLKLEEEKQKRLADQALEQVKFMDRTDCFNRVASMSATIAIVTQNMDKISDITEKNVDFCMKNKGY